MGSAQPSRGQGRWFRAPPRFMVTLVIVGVVAFVLELLIMMLLPALQDVLDPGMSSLLDAATVGLLVAPAVAMVAVTRHPGHGADPGVAMVGRRGLIGATMVVLGGLVASGLAVWSAETQARRREVDHFHAMKDRLGRDLTRRLGRYSQGLHGAAGVWPASESVQRGEFDAMVATYDMVGEYSGALGLGFIRRVPRDGLDAFLADTRADGEPGFAVRSSSTEANLYVVEYLSPRQENRGSLGEDLATDPVCREAADRAMLTGQMALSAPLPVRAGSGTAPGYLAILPVYGTGAVVATPEERRAALRGWVYMPVVLEHAVADARSVVGGELDFEIFGPGLGVSTPVPHEEAHSGGLLSRLMMRDQPLREAGSLEVGGRSWPILYTSTPRFVRASRTAVMRSARAARSCSARCTSTCALRATTTCSPVVGAAGAEGACWGDRSPSRTESGPIGGRVTRISRPPASWFGRPASTLRGCVSNSARM